MGSRHPRMAVEVHVSNAPRNDMIQRFGYSGSGKRAEPIKGGAGPTRYFAIHEAGLRNGSFYRVSRHGVAQWINGDCMGKIEEVPALYYKQSLVEFDRETAERLIPSVCR